MFGYIKNNFLYLKCPKNGCMTYSTLLNKHGWEEINLFDNDLDLSAYKIWAHITNPEDRHSRGVVQYLRFNPSIDYTNPEIGKLLVSGVFDEHTYSLNMMLGKLMTLPINWIPLDANVKRFGPDLPPEGLILDGDALTNEFFKENNIDIVVSKADRLNVSGFRDKQVKQEINRLKETHRDNYSKLVKNFLEQDIILYLKTVARYAKINS